MKKYRNYRELTQKEVDQLKELYPATTNRELSKLFGISVDAIQDRFAYPNGWRKENFKRGNRGGKSLTEKQVAWIVKHYKHTPNRDIMDKFGIGESTLHRVARKCGLTKSKQYMKKVANENNANAMATCRRYKVYEQSAEFARQQWRERKERGETCGFKKGESLVDRIGLKRARAAWEKTRIARNETIRKERIRINWGFEQKTKLKLTSAGKKAIASRHLLKKANYIVERGSMYVYYDDLTERNLILENRARINGIKIEEAV